MIGAAAPASADDAAGASCGSNQLGAMSSSADGTVVRCVASGGSFTWMSESGAVSTIADLESKGYSVRIDRVGSGPLTACRVNGVRNPITTTRTDNENSVNGLPEVIVLNQTVNVSLDCT